MPYLKELDLAVREGDRATQRKFRLSVRSLGALVMRLAPRIRNEKYKKILVRCVSGEPRLGPTNQLGVAFVEVQRDIAEFDALVGVARQRWALVALREGVSKVLDSDGFRPEMLDDAFEEAEALGFENRWCWRRKRSPDQRHFAELWVEHGSEACKLRCVVVDRQGALKAEHVLATTEPDEWAFSKLLGELLWAGSKRVQLVSGRGLEVGFVLVGAG